MSWLKKLIPTAPIVCALLLFCAAPALGQQSSGPDIYRLSLPDKAWALDVDLSGYRTSPDLLNDVPSALQFLAAAKAHGQSKPATPEAGHNVQLMAAPGTMRDHFAMLTITLEPTQIKGDAAALRAAVIEAYVNSKRMSKGRIKTFEYKQFPAARISMPDSYDDGVVTFSFQGPPLKILEAYQVQDGVLITCRYMAQPLTDADEKLFYALLDSIKITDTSHPVSSFDYYQLGHALYLQKEYAKAVEALGRALVLEHKERSLSGAQWRSMVEDAADAFGAVGDRARAKQIMEYGVSNDPTYPYFYLGLARLYASLGDMDNTITYLQQAFQHARTWPKTGFGGPLPDPMFDAAFAAFKNDPKFREAVKAMKKLL